eukprot:TRINITY_DN19255_c0_g1_i1.p1 TRINITY_DN19255_c0_g1~~TRINITY_DN19255_c0_g1_i1.p1  ORF type:complete len:559 (-),score=100.09 TRINITY_DN19255_c0_g1_i1:701-2377(-)
MEVFQEVVVGASSVEGSVVVWDLRTGQQLGNYKHAAAPRNGMCAIGRDYLGLTQILQAGGGAGGIWFWLWQKASAVLKCFPTEAVGPLTASADGSFLAAGALSGRLYLWEVTTGTLLRRWQGHHRAVNTLVFTDDDSTLLSGADDGLVRAWYMIKVLDSKKDAGAASGEGGDCGHQSLVPRCSWSEHSQAVTGLFVGAGGSSGLVVSCSADHTCKFFSLATGTLLRSVVFPVAINVTLLDPGEYCLYGGGADGRIFITPLNFGVQGGPSAVADAGQGDGLLHGHERAVTALAFSLDGVLLVSASEDCTACVWCTASKKILRRLEHPKGPISSLLLLPRPPQMLFSSGSSTTPGHLSASSARPASTSWPLVPLVALGNSLDAPRGSGFRDAAQQEGAGWEGCPVALPAFVDRDGEGGGAGSGGSRLSSAGVDERGKPSFSRAVMEKGAEAAFRLQENRGALGSAVALELRCRRSEEEASRLKLKLRAEAERFEVGLTKCKKTKETAQKVLAAWARREQEEKSKRMRIESGAQETEAGRGSSPRSPLHATLPASSAPVGA